MAGWLDVTSAVAADYIHDRMVNPLPVVSLGLEAFDRTMMSWGMGKGLVRGTYCIVGGASNVGKTQYGLCLARNAANAGERAGVISLDMKKADALLRLHQALVPEIPNDRWRPDRWLPEYGAKLKDGLVRWRKSVKGELGLDAMASGDVEYVLAELTKGVEAGVTYFVVDHLQKVSVRGVGHPAERAEIISEALDNFCDEHEVTIVGLSQLNREASRDRTRVPIMQDLLGGTSLESNTQVVIMLDHSRYERDEQHPHLGRTFLLLDKNQQGPKGFECAVEIDHRNLGYREARPDELHLWPGEQQTNGNGRRR